MVVTDLDTSTINRQHAAVFVAEFLVWWHQAGRHFYQYSDDDGLKAFANDAVSCAGGWKDARRMLQSLDLTTKTLIEAKGVLL